MQLTGQKLMQHLLLRRKKIFVLPVAAGKKIRDGVSAEIFLSFIFISWRVMWYYPTTHKEWTDTL